MRRPETARVTLVNARRRIVSESVGAAAVMYAVAGGSEAALIRGIRPTALELAWVSDIVLSAAFGVVVCLWRHLLASRRELAERERAERSDGLEWRPYLSSAAWVDRARRLVAWGL
jgi:predicted outer membrane lipoprotein